ncbi:hypothetical protein DO97_03735 [Neosynechococcus sphagnicola sy1]|uniref:Uncharacterized protein n=1 Tax=Neosynechococcus sphagnicola sy1 TaxID=1497020 RepID=A0A098TKN3_9CYAN|nr:hypothetical protein [Neosynechococcus sphagnicola]KGF72849.1 hypothetical protein DO97_03735 [Neosynechococcus sphagnicola sy1]
MSSWKSLVAIACVINAVATSPTHSEAVIVNVPKIAGKNQAQVSKVIGKPKSCKQSKYGRKCIYTKADTEIVFIKGKADWITINKMPGAKYDKSSLALLGFPVKTPTFANLNAMRWGNIPGFLEVSFFPEGSSISYAYIKTKTE